MKNKKPYVSVVMPVFNAELYISEAIESILGQTYTDFEFIIINDGSSDGTESVIKSYTDDRIVYIKQENAGVGITLRNGCAMAQGKFIARMDADDISLPDRLAKQVKFMEKNTDVVLISSAVKYINEKGAEIGRSFPYTSHWAIVRKMKFSSPICHPAAMFRRNIYELSGGYKNIQPFEDLILWLAFLKYGKLHNLSNPLLKYRILNSSVSHSIQKEDQTKLLQFLLNKIDNEKFNNETIIEYRQFYNEIKAKTQKVNKTLIQVKKNNLKGLPSKIECQLFQYFTKLKIPTFISEFLICTLKNLSLFFRE